MPPIPDYIVRRVEEAARIEEVVADFVTLKHKGARYLGLCPFHDDHTIGSFSVYPAKNVYKCFKCDAKGGPVQFLMKHPRVNMTFPDAIRWLGRKYGVQTDDIDVNYVPPPPPPPPVRPILELPRLMMAQREDTSRNTLCNWIRTGIRWSDEQRARIEQVLKDYHVGTAKNGMTIFWQIDETGIVRDGKMMLYKPDGHRDKTKGYNFDWVHASLARPVIVKGADGWPVFDEEGKPVMEVHHRDIYDADKMDYKIVPFGLHLLDRYPKAGVNIVESEKTALLMAIACGNNAGQVWMACGGLEMLSRERLMPIINQRRIITLYPDRDGVEKWRAKVRSFGYDLMTVNSDPVLKWWHEGDGEKADIADVVINALNRI